MEVLDQQAQVTVNSLPKLLQRDELAYAESVGKSEKRSIAEIIHNTSGEGTVVRLFFGATAEMPARGLSYITAASRIAEYIPHEQVQIIFANNIGCEVNGLSKRESQHQARLLAELGKKYIGLHHPDIVDTYFFGEDVPSPKIKELRPAVTQLIESDEKLARRLKGKGSKHGEDYATYSAAHIFYQEMADMSPVGLSGEEPEPLEAQRIVSIGCQQEHPFYRLRVAARRAFQDEEFIPTAQVFTKHLLPPYYVSRGGEQTLENMVQSGIDVLSAGDDSVRRDLTYLRDVALAEEVCHE